ncbi:hypothetical protein ACFOGI_15050 [Virgibacillus xinjiangensis]|uniref:Spore coat protein n=1 Tax=Virgibacillus xinjiangensis TaxID=393090 RepID=A0ABV7CYT2_9BACI
MAMLPSVDLGLMAEHLKAHEGVISKLQFYQSQVDDNKLKKILELQENMMLAHVKVMLGLIHPYEQNYIEVPPLVFSNHHHDPVFNIPNSHQKWIALEAKNTAKSMSNRNYVSALMMNNQNARNAHVEMALQQLAIQERLEAFINRMGWGFFPKATREEQIQTYQQFHHLLQA